MHVATVLKFVGFCLGIEQEKIKPRKTYSYTCTNIAAENAEVLVHLTIFCGGAVIGGG